MKAITEQEAKEEIEKGKEEIRRILNEGGKVTDTIVYEKDKITTTRKIEPVNKKVTSSKTTQTINEIIINS